MKNYQDKLSFESHSIKEPGAKVKMKELGIVHHGVAVQDKKGKAIWSNATHRLTKSDLEKAVKKVLE
tara:strand:+ start:320 stop:520 length:201 start_codon:yes stop_codon:yes gene_type:complete